MADVTLYADSNGGEIGTSAASMAALFAKTTGSGYGKENWFQANVKAEYFEIYQPVFRFNTSSIPAGSTIDAVVLELRVRQTGDWDPYPAGVIEAYPIAYCGDDFQASLDLLSVAQAQTAYSNDARLARSPIYPGQGQAENTDYEFISDAAFASSLNLSGYTNIVLIPANWRTETSTTQFVQYLSQHHETQAYRPRLHIEYTEGEPPSGGAIPVIMHHLKQQGIS